jgi:hypothetical protein
MIVYGLMRNYFPWSGANQAQMSRQILAGDFQILDSVLSADLI